MIRRLGNDVISELRSGVALSSLSQCVDELVLNSIDAGSTSITIDINVCTASLEVNDNGDGVLQSDMKSIGQRYFTSKCHKVSDLTNAASYGFRGEALASLCKISQKMEVVSRHKATSRTFCKLFKKSRDMGTYEGTELRPRHGTTVKACGLFYNLPVRQKLISEKMDLEQIRRSVLAIALINPSVSLLVRCSDNDATLLQTHSCSSTLSVISQTFGWEKGKGFKPIAQTAGVYTTSGFVNIEGFPNKNIQFVYVNKRPVLKTRLHNVANHVLSRAISGLMHDNFSKRDQNSCASPTKLKNYAGFVINIECPCNTYDITFDPKKTLVEFQNWDGPISCLRSGLNEFLKREGIFNEELLDPDCQESNSSLSRELHLVQQEVNVLKMCGNGTKKPITASDLKRSLYSSTAKRKCNGSAGGMCSGSNSGLKNLRNANKSSSVESSADQKDGTTCVIYSLDSEECLTVGKGNTSRLDNPEVPSKLQRYSGVPSSDNVSLSERSTNFSENMSKRTEVTLKKKAESLEPQDGKRQWVNSEDRSDVYHRCDVSPKRMLGAQDWSNDVRNSLDFKRCLNVSERPITTAKDRSSNWNSREIDVPQSTNMNVTTNYNETGSVSESSKNTIADHRWMADVNTAISTDRVSSNAESELSVKDSDWLFQCNPHNGQPLYINLRTGNTSLILPSAQSTAVLPKNTYNSVEQTDATKFQPFRDFAAHLSHNFTPWLPKKVSPSRSFVACGENNHSSGIGDMFEQWVNPVFQRNEKLVTDVSDCRMAHVKLQSTAQPLKFTKDCFKNMKVINQLDNKFILCYYKGGNNDNHLVVVDQHAAHERVRLETFTKDLYMMAGAKVVLKSSPLKPPCELSLSDHDIQLMQAFRAQLQEVGITFDICLRSSDIQTSVRIKAVPSVFVAREFTGIKKCIEDLIKEHIEVLLSTKGVSTTAQPKAITRLLNSQACHGAIRFGDPLSTEECKNLMESLSSCDLPFQCAHGRPSMIPVINTTTLTENGMPKKMSNLPHISRIRERIKGKSL